MTAQPLSVSRLDPHNEYAQRLEARRRSLADLQQRSRKIWITRRILFGIIFVMGILAFDHHISAWWILLPVVAFVALMVRHQRMHREEDRLTRGVKFYERGQARLEDRWAGTGETGVQFAEKQHPYAEDLDLFGEGSLFELLSTARTKAGEGKLAQWLKAPAGIEEIRARQAAVEELRAKLDLREDLALLGAEVRAGVHTEEVETWGKAPPVFTAKQIPVLLMIIATTGVLTLAAVVIWFQYGVRLPTLAAVLCGLFIYSRYRQQVSQVISAVERPSRELNLLSEILARLEAESFQTPKLAALRARLDTNAQPPSVQIARLNRLTQILDSTKNQFFAPIAFLALIPPQLALRIERWRQTTGAHIPAWLDAVAEIEALNALANFAYEHPQHPFPEIVEHETCLACFEGQQIGHPLIAAARCVRNDVQLNSRHQLLIISGSNMSGKSTLMRTIGV
ncbi:MAG: DNA mismatch repair protein MutS, partial [Acidobacteriota bacterium]